MSASTGNDGEVKKSVCVSSSKSQCVCFEFKVFGEHLNGFNDESFNSLAVRHESIVRLFFVAEKFAACGVAFFGDVFAAENGGNG